MGEWGEGQGQGQKGTLMEGIANVSATGTGVVVVGGDEVKVQRGCWGAKMLLAIESWIGDLRWRGDSWTQRWIAENTRSKEMALGRCWTAGVQY